MFKHFKNIIYIFSACLILASAPVSAETGKYNIHIEISPSLPLSGWQSRDLGLGISGSARFELVLKQWVGLEVGGGYSFFSSVKHPDGFEQYDHASLITANLGARFRLINDDNGYLWPWKSKPNHAGNIKGNLWMDVHGNYFRTGALNRFGADSGIGYEFSLLNGLQIGPFARFTYIYQPDTINNRDSDDAYILNFGISGSIAMPSGAKFATDLDKDGYYDPQDSCPNNPEDFDGFEDEDGCPDDDNDNDGILDVDDQCPDKAEIVNGIDDEDGCPDYDNDNDGIADSKDDCPNSPEDFDGFEDEDGCPDDDNDNDSILDVDDQCPDKAEIINGVDDNDGCPDEALVEVRGKEILGGEHLYFDFGMARIKTKSMVLLEHLTTLLKTHPEYVLISVEGNADNKGTELFNRKLSVKRAKRVKQGLIQLGIDSKRISVIGHGEENPAELSENIGNNKIRALNRRVEFYIIETDETLINKPKTNSKTVSKKTEPDSQKADEHYDIDPAKKTNKN